MSITATAPLPGRVLAIIRDVDAWLDAATADTYRDQPLAQHWARVTKTSEEAGEATAALIALTGQNPRKGICGTLDDLLAELADVACAGLFAIQHFTKDENRTAAVLLAALDKAMARADAAKPDGGWACACCGDGFYSTAPDDMLCPGCRDEDR